MTCKTPARRTGALHRPLGQSVLRAIPEDEAQPTVEARAWSQGVRYFRNRRLY